MQYRSILLILAAGSLAACNAPNASVTNATDPLADSLVCMPKLVSAVMLTLRDAKTQAPIAYNAVVSAQISTSQGSFSETHVGSDSLFVPVGVVPGTYNLLVKKSGYADLTKNGIVVPAVDGGGGSCIPNTVSVDIRLQPNS